MVIRGANGEVVNVAPITSAMIPQSQGSDGGSRISNEQQRIQRTNRQETSMTNNDILRRIRYIFDLSDSEMISLFNAADQEIKRSEVSDLLKRSDDSAHLVCSDTLLATFLNGFINDRRGKKEGPQPEPETELTNNIIFRKMKIALNLNAEDTLEILALAGMRVSKHELSAFFRRPGHKHYRDCKDQMIRCFLSGLQIRYRDTPP
jgi:uncharacterized protein YehS (DUF1456 family)